MNAKVKIEVDARTADLLQARAAGRGISVADLSPDLRSQFGIKSDVQGVVVTAVDPGSAAEDKRLQAGDVISMVGEEQVSTPTDFDDQIAAMKKDGRANVRLVVQSKEGHVRFVNLPLAD